MQGGQYCIGCNLSLVFSKIFFSELWKASVVVLLTFLQIARALAFTCRRAGGSNLCCVKFINFSSLALGIGNGLDVHSVCVVTLVLS